MDKKKQRSLNVWLKQQSKLAKRWLMIAVGLGVLSSIFLLGQAALLATILHQLIIEQVDKYELVPYFLGLVVTVAARAACSWGREIAGFNAGKEIRVYIRQLIFDKLRELGPAYIKGKPAGAWATLTLEQVENMHDFFAYVWKKAIREKRMKEQKRRSTKGEERGNNVETGNNIGSISNRNHRT